MCLAQVLGFRTALGATIAATGLPIIPKPYASEGTSKGTSIASTVARQAIDRSSKPTQLPYGLSLPAPTFRQPLKKTTRVATAAGRLFPGIGWGLLGYDAILFYQCVKEHCSNDECQE